MTSTPSPSTIPTTLTARTPEDLLAVAPVVLGFWPTDSVVMLTFGARHAFHARVDLPRDRDDLWEMADLLVGPAVAHDVPRVVLLVYSDDPGLATAAWHALRDGLAGAGIDVVEAVRVSATRWYPLRGADRHSRLLGVPYDVSAHPFLAQAVLDGRVTHGSRAELARTLAPDEGALARVRAHVDAILAGVDAAGSRGDHTREAAWMVALVTRLLDDPDETVLDDRACARLLVGLQDRELRDAVWQHLSEERVRAAVGLWSSVLRRSPHTLAAAPAGLLAWSAWQHGNGALAWCAVDRCREVDPDHGLAHLVATALERAVPPSVGRACLDTRHEGV